MAAAQEFSSPAEHMASLNNNSSNKAFSDIKNGSYSNVIYAPPVDTQSSNAKRYKDDLYESNDFNRSNYDYANAINYNIYNDAKSWYERMQNTSIQRMVEDMKKAGINPILAGKYGGYNVAFPSLPYNNNMPYLDISSYGSVLSSHERSLYDLIMNNDNISSREKNLELELLSNYKIALRELDFKYDQLDQQWSINKVNNLVDEKIELMKEKHDLTNQEINLLRVFGDIIKSVSIAGAYAG